MIGEFFGFAPSVVDNMKQCLVLASILNNICRKIYSLKLIDFYYIGTWQLAAYAGLSVSVCQRNFQCPNRSTTIPVHWLLRLGVTSGVYYLPIMT